MDPRFREDDDLLCNSHLQHLCIPSPIKGKGLFRRPPTYIFFISILYFFSA